MEPYITFEGYRIACSAIEYIPPAVKHGDGYAIEFHLKSGKCVTVPIKYDNEFDANREIDGLDDLIMERCSDYRKGLVECFVGNIDGFIPELVEQIREGWNEAPPP